MSAYHSLKVADVRRETADAVSIAFEVPSALTANFKFDAGQYITIKYTNQGEEIRRSYSICSSPNSSELRVAVKAIPNGIFSQYATQTLKAGDFLEISEPEGNFTFTPHANETRNYAAFAAGSGITPILSIVYSVLESEPNATFVLVYGNKTPNDAIFNEELLRLQKEFTGRFFLHSVYSKANVEHAIFGRIDASTINFVLKNKYNHLEFNKYYLCGPEEMINTVSAVLKSHNVKEKDIRFELFLSTAPAATVNTGEGNTKITVLVDDEETTFEMPKKMSLLEASLKQGVDAPYSCQGGICSSCICRVTVGSAVMKKNQILTESEIAQGLILSCQAYPTSDEIYIDFDDV